MLKRPRFERWGAFEGFAAVMVKAEVSPADEGFDDGGEVLRDFVEFRVVVLRVSEEDFCGSDCERG